MPETKLTPPTEPTGAPATINVRVLFFASLADLMGGRQRSLALAAHATVSDALRELAQSAPDFASRVPHVSFAVNEAFVGADTPLSDGDELALIPPVSGG
ncbi:MAG: molybdopterin converting factor subunit 1 [Chloroflexota bacterium]|nr:molybdopterin converting factor subunit 1 [Chloroflexota bacterium]MDE2920609.1 molybdopterin converting factor subunit 1 [Chloroflexota bacterium]